MSVDPRMAVLRAGFLRIIREFFWDTGFIEVDTPIRLPLLIPERHIVPIQSENHFLQTSPEICMKRLLASGLPAIFQICHCFRKDERGKRHLEEFTMVEWYRLHADYRDLMDDCGIFLKYLLHRISELDGLLPGLAQRAQRLIDEFGDGPERLTVADAFLLYSPVSLSQSLSDDTYEEILVEHIEPHLGRSRPLILYDYPAEHASLAKKQPGNSNCAERFELYLHGIELANGFTELTDPVEQRKRFIQAIYEIENLEQRVAEMPESFLEDLGKIPEAAGIALGVDRLFMLLCGRDDIRQVVNFPA